MKKNKRKIIYKGDSSYPDVPSSGEAVYSAQCASIFRSSNDGLKFKAEVVHSQKLSQLTTLSRHYSYICPPALLCLAVLCHNNVLCLFLE